MHMWEPDEAMTRDLLQTCSEIFKQQPVTHLDKEDVFCPDSSLTAPRMVNPQYLRLSTCKLPSDFVRSLIRQMFGAGDSLQYLMLHFMDLSPFGSLLDKLLEDLVANHEAQKGQDKLVLVLQLVRDNLSERFKIKWRERCRRVKSISYVID